MFETKERYIINITKEERWHMFWIGWMESYIENINSTYKPTTKPLSSIKYQARKEFEKTINIGD